MDFTVRTDVLLIILVVSFVLFGHTLLGSADISPYDASGFAANSARVELKHLQDILEKLHIRKKDLQIIHRHSHQILNLV